MNRTLPEPTRDVALLIARLLLGTIMFAHGYQKLMIDGLGRTTQGFETMSIPVAIVSAAFVTVVEIVGGVLVILGALLTVVAAFYLVVMVGAAVFVHIPNGVFVANNGWELVGAIAGLLLALAAAGSGRFGVDHFIRSRQSPATAPVPAPDPAVASAPSPAWSWPSRPAVHHDHSARATAFTEVLPQVSAVPPQVSAVPPQVSTDPAAAPLPVRRPRPTPSATPSPPPPSPSASTAPLSTAPLSTASPSPAAPTLSSESVQPLSSEPARPPSSPAPAPLSAPPASAPSASASGSGSGSADGSSSERFAAARSSVWTLPPTTRTTPDGDR